MTPAQLREDILTKAHKLDVRVRFNKRPFDASFDLLDRRANLTPIQDWGMVTSPPIDWFGRTITYHQTPEVSYFVALHELGHAATLPHIMFRHTEEDTLNYEAAAWDWAARNSAIPVTTEMRQAAVRSLESYAFGSPLRKLPAQFEQTYRRLSDPDVKLAA